MSELFVHVDVDDLWAIAECYGLTAPAAKRHFVYEDGVPRLLDLLGEMRLRATFFVCGADAAEPECARVLKEALCRGHRLANHSLRHRLDFRRLSRQQMRDDIVRSHAAIEDRLGTRVTGFRAPGYAWSGALLETLAEADYLYDSSLMPSPFGMVFRALDARLTRRVGGQPRMKTQYPRLADVLHPVRPFDVSLAGGRKIIELPVAAAPFVRLPFQASVCLQLGDTYFGAMHRLIGLARLTPVVFLLHAADTTDFARTDWALAARHSYFASDVQRRVARLRSFLTDLAAGRRVLLTEEWVEGRLGCL
jgi:hypothetical protein